MPNGTLNYARVTIAMSVCWNTSTRVLTSANCTYGSAVLRPATYAVAGTLRKTTIGGAGSRSISCETNRRFRLDRPAPSPDLYATPRVLLAFAEGRFVRVQPMNSVFDS